MQLRKLAALILGIYVLCCPGSSLAVNDTGIRPCVARAHLSPKLRITNILFPFLSPGHTPHEPFSAEKLTTYLSSLPRISVSDEQIRPLQEKPIMAYVTSELDELSKRGGLGDVAWQYPHAAEKALSARGHHIVRILPLFRRGSKGEPLNYQRLGWELSRITDANNTPITVMVTIQGRQYPTQLVLGRQQQDGVLNIFLDNHELSQEPYIKINHDEGRAQAIWFSQATLEAVRALGINVRLFHLNDWQSSLIAAYLRGPAKVKKPNRYHGIAARAGIILTVHNPLFQGRYGRDTYEETGLPEELYTETVLELDVSPLIEFHGDWSMLKAALKLSDIVYTVSPTYAEEIQTSEAGHGLEGIFRWLAHHNRLHGALNGIDPEKYQLAQTKPDYKNELQRYAQTQGKNFTIDPDKPLVATVSRIATQKGLDLLAAIIPQLVENNMQVAILGTAAPGDNAGTKVEKELKRLEKEYPEHVVFFNQFNTIVSTVYAAADMFVMPSDFEPCGLGQLIAMRYGTIPVVRAVGGLADTIIDIRYSPDGNGFTFSSDITDRNASADAFLKTIEAAYTYWQYPNQWDILRQNALHTDSSWDKRAKETIGFYDRILLRFAADGPAVKPRAHLRTAAASSCIQHSL